MAFGVRGSTTEQGFYMWMTIWWVRTQGIFDREIVGFDPSQYAFM